MMPTASTTLAIDAGQTGIRVRHSRGTPGTGDGRTPPTILDFAGIRTDRELLPQLVDVVVQFCARTSLSVNIVAAGVSGLTALKSRADDLLAGLRPVGASAVFLAHDSITGYLGSLGTRQGAVIAAGTGVVTLGVGPAVLARVDGWGHLVGDAGSGYWIGRAALDAALRAYDGRGKDTSLTRLLEENFTSPETAYIELQAHPDRVKLIASFARDVAVHAQSDAVALAVINSAGSELARSVATALRRAELVGGKIDGPGPSVSWAGSLLSGHLLFAAFEMSLCNLVPKVQLVAPLGSPLDGVALLPSLSRENPLHAEVQGAGAL
jgi:glucosamine kinase